MAFRAVLILVAGALFLVDARSISRRNEDVTKLGGWRNIDKDSVPEDVVSHARDQMIETLTHDTAIRFVEITSAKSQNVAGKNYKLDLVFHDTECSSSASIDDVNDETVCPTTEFITCTVVVHKSYDDTLTLREMQCIR